MPHDTPSRCVNGSTARASHRVSDRIMWNKATRQVLGRKVLKLLTPTYITNQRFVQLYGERVTSVRAWLCVVLFLVNSHIVLARDVAGLQIRSVWHFLEWVFSYFVVYLGIVGFGSVFSFWLVAWFILLFVRAAISVSVRGLAEGTDALEQIAEEWITNCTLLVCEGYIFLYCLLPIILKS